MLSTSQEFLQDLDLIKAMPHPLAASMPPPVAVAAVPVVALTDPIPLDPGVGGQSIGPAALNAGDLIISTTSAFSSGVIRYGTGSEVSHAMVYIGNGQVVEAIRGGVVERPLTEAIADARLAVAYRHPGMTPVLAEQLTIFLRSKKGSGYNYGGLVRIAPSQLLHTLCARLPESMQDRCMSYLPSFRPGTDANQEFFCSQLVFEGLQSIGLFLTDVVPNASAPQEIVRLAHNGSLHYVGHLKALLP